MNDKPTVTQLESMNDQNCNNNASGTDDIRKEYSRHMLSNSEMIQQKATPLLNASTRQKSKLQHQKGKSYLPAHKSAPFQTQDAVKRKKHGKTRAQILREAAVAQDKASRDINRENSNPISSQPVHSVKRSTKSSSYHKARNFAQERYHTVEPESDSCLPQNSQLNDKPLEPEFIQKTLSKESLDTYSSSCKTSIHSASNHDPCEQHEPPSQTAAHQGNIVHTNDSDAPSKQELIDFLLVRDG